MNQKRVSRLQCLLRVFRGEFFTPEMAYGELAKQEKGISKSAVRSLLIALTGFRYGVLAEEGDVFLSEVFPGDNEMQDLILKELKRTSITTVYYFSQENEKTIRQLSSTD